MRKKFILVIALGFMLMLSNGSAQAAPTINLIRNTIISSNATAISSYNTNVNVASYRQQGIMYYSGFQFVSWYNGNARNVIVGRRTVNQSNMTVGTWQWAYVNYTLASGGDSHNVMSLAISPNDGRLHVAIGQHDVQFYYIRTLANAATGAVWDNTVFGGTASAPATPMAGLPGYGAATNNVTYPYFMNAGDAAKTLQLAYRTGSSGKGRFQLAEYNTSTGNWTALGQFTGSTGNYTQNGVTSSSRNAYPHGLTYDYSGRLHMAFTFRENLSTHFIANCDATINNHDTLYVYSDDRGRNWKNSAGTTVGTTGSNDITITDSGLVVDPLPVGRDLMNQETQMMDKNNLFHAIISYTPGRYFPNCAQNRQQVQPFHLWRNGSGAWTKVEIKINGADVNQGYNRSKVFFSSTNNMYVVLPDLRVVAASASTNWTDWTLVYDGRGLGNFGETVIDSNLTRVSNFVSVLYMKGSGATAEFHVLDFSVS